MQISVKVPYDDRRVRRTIRFVLRRTVRKLRVLGVVMAVAGAVLLLTGSDWQVPTLLMVLGPLYALALEPFLVWQSLRAQNDAVRQDYELIVDDAGVEVRSPSAGTRLAWSAIQRVEEQPDAWFLVVGKVQALAVHKDLMTEQQRTGFASLLAGRQLV